MMDDNDISIKSSHISYKAITDTGETIRRMKYLNIRHAIVPSVPEKFNKDFASNFDLDEDTWCSFGKDLSYLFLSIRKSLILFPLILFLII